MTLAPWVLGVIAVYVIALTWLFTHLAVSDWRRSRARKRKAAVFVAEVMGGDLSAPLDPVEQHYADTVGIALSPEAAEQARLRALAEADGAEAAFVSPGHRETDAFLAELFGPRTKDAPKEQP